MDLHLSHDFYDSFIVYQTRMLKVFDRMSVEYGFQVLDASRSVNRVAATLRQAVARVIDEAPHRTGVKRPSEEPESTAVAEEPGQRIQPGKKDRSSH